MANGTNSFKVGNLVNNAHPLPDASVSTSTGFNQFAAAGTTQLTATPLYGQIAFINNNTAANGVILPVGLKGQIITIYPALATNAPKVYPPVGGTINSVGTVNTNTTATAQTKTTFYCLDDSGLNWF